MKSWSMVRWSPWKSALAGAVIGFLEAAGSEHEKRAAHRPLAVVRFDERQRDRLARPAGLWFLDPLPRPGGDDGGSRREAGKLQLDRITPLRLARELAGRFTRPD